ncbi:MAG: DUF5667 domain-containing protein, partial [Dehalococcoidia bacterium]
MSKFITLFLGMILALAVAVPAMPASADSAEVTTIGEATTPAILPDSGLNFLNSWGRNIQLAFAGSDAEKARLMLKYSGEDALALKAMYTAGKYDAGARQSEQYALQMENTVQAVEQVRASQGEEASAELVAKLEQNYLRQQEVLLSVMEKAPEAAQSGLLNAIENSNKHVATTILAHEGEQALLQYQTQVNQQTTNLGSETRIKVQQKLQAVHGQSGQSSGNSGGQGVQAQTQTETQTQIQAQTQAQTQTEVQTPSLLPVQVQVQATVQTQQQTGLQNQNQGSGSSNAGSGTSG